MSAVETSGRVTGRQAWAVDPTHTLVEFSARHMMITTVKGRIAGVRGTVLVDAGEPSNSLVDVELDAATVDTRSEDRDAHLRSGDFLDVESYPVIRFRSVRVEGEPREAGDEFRLVGELTIRDVTREVVLDAVFEGGGRDPWGGERLSYSATTKVDRRDFGLSWNQALETGGVLVSNELKIQVEVQLVRAE